MESPPDRFGPLVHNRFGEPYFPSVNGEAFSLLGAEAYFRRYYGQRLWEPDSLFVVVGSDSGLLIRHLLSRPLPQGSHYLFVELGDLIPRLRQELFPQGFPEAVHLCSPREWLEEAKALGMHDYFFLGRAYLERSVAAADQLLGEYQQMWRQVNEEMTAQRFGLKIASDSKYFHIRALENLTDNRWPATLLQNACPGATAVVLGGGPSMERLIPWVREHRSHLLLLAVGRLAPRLMELELVPDVVVSMDPNPVSFVENVGLLDLPPTTLYLCSFHVESHLPSQRVGPILYTGTLFPWTTPLNPANIPILGLTVGNHAVELAMEMGCTTVIVGGLDFCYSPEGYCHTGGTWERRAGPNLSPTELLVETNGGWQAESRHDLLSAARVLDGLARSVEPAGVRIINPAPEAVRLPHVPHLPVTGLPPPAVPDGPTPLERLTARLPVDGSAQRLEHLQMLREELLRVRREAEKMLKLAKEALTCNERLFGRGGKPGDFRFKKRMDAIEVQLDRDHLELGKLVKLWGLAKFRALIKPRDSAQWSDQEVEEMGRGYYTIYRDTCQDFLEHVDRAAHRVRVRLEEEKPRPDYKLLTAQWTRDEQYQRYRVWLERRGMTLEELPEPVARQWRELEERFQGMVERLHHQLEGKGRDETSLERLLSKGRYWFGQRDGARLSHLVDGFSRLVGERGELAQGVELLRGYQAELGEGWDEALSHYAAVREPLLRMEALTRLALVALRSGRHGEALPVLEELAAITPTFQPLLADLLRILGRGEQAVAVLEGYLEQGSRDDPLAGLKLARLLVELHRNGAAREQLRTILQRHPDNATARQMLAALPPP